MGQRSGIAGEMITHYQQTTMALGGLLLMFFAGCSQEVAEQPADSEIPTSESAVAQRIQLQLDNALAGWVASGMAVSAGDAVALFADGVLEADGNSFEPRHLLWYRVGENGDAVQFMANQEAFVTATDGEVFITLRPGGFYWSDRRGSYPEAFTSAPPVPMNMTIELVRFSGPLNDGLTALSASGDASAQLALQAQAARKRLPDGFDHLWILARSNVWAQGAIDGRPGITADTDDDVGIVKMPLDLVLNADTRFGFEWRYDAVPALGPETSAQFHDYLSIALEFDNGQDLTWMWSAELPEGTHFACPLPGWEEKETHWVLQTGSEGLGRWFAHQRPVLEDYQAAIGGEPPTRIVGIWFIANSLFGRQRAAASFADVAIENGQSRTVVF